MITLISPGSLAIISDLAGRIAKLSVGSEIKIYGLVWLGLSKMFKKVLRGITQSGDQ
jgi:hypothetical protein